MTGSLLQSRIQSIGDIMGNFIVSEVEVSPAPASYQQIFAGGVQNGDSISIRNTTDKDVRIRFNEEDDNSFTVQAGKEFSLYSLDFLRGSIVEVKSKDGAISTSGILFVNISG